MSQETRAARDVIAERLRQINEEGWTPEHDDQHSRGELADAAAVYASPKWTDAVSKANGYRPVGWPWHLNWYKPKDRRRNCVRAAALLIAEIERLDRAADKAAAHG